MDDLSALGHLYIQELFLDPHLLELLVFVPPVDKLLDLLSRLEWIHVDVTPHVKVVVLEIT